MARLGNVVGAVGRVALEDGEDVQVMGGSWGGQRGGSHLEDVEADGVGIMAAVAARLAGVGLCQLDDELRVRGRSMRSSPWLLLRHEMKLVHLPAVSSIQRDVTAYRVQRSSSMRHMYVIRRAQSRILSHALMPPMPILHQRHRV